MTGASGRPRPRPHKPSRRRGPTPRKRAPRRRQRLVLYASLSGVVALLAVAVGAVLVWAVSRPAYADSVAVFAFADDASPREQAATLERVGLVDDASWMWAYLWLSRPLARPEPGQHLVRLGMSPRQVVEWTARLRRRPARKLVIPEGWTHLQIAARLQQERVCTADGFVDAVQDPRLLRSLSISGPSAEGFLYPATYDLRVNSHPRDVVRRLATEAQRRLAALHRAHPGARARLQRDLGWGDEEIIELASIVQKEAARVQEMPIIASVFFNRLTSSDFRPARMLQSDPTAAYGCLVAPERAPSCAGFTGQVTPALLRDPANTYNTYQNPGLPPGPISNPGAEAVAAVLEPATTDYFFFVADGKGRHTFSRTYGEHKAAVASSKANDSPRGGT